MFQFLRNRLMPCLPAARPTRGGGKQMHTCAFCLPSPSPLFPPQVIDCQQRGEPAPAAALPDLAVRSAHCAQLARRLRGLSLRDGPGVAALLEAALELAGGEAPAAKA